MDNDTSAVCWSNHLGMWCIEPIYFLQAVAAFKAGLWPLRAFSTPQIEAAEPREKRPYQMTGKVALIPLHGPMSKGGSFKFDGVSTVRTHRALRQAARDDDVDSILLEIDSPGGHVAGTQELADEVYRTRQMKPIGAHISDLGASAALWVASQAGFVAANPTAEVGSIGTVLALEDSSKRMERLGIDVHVLSTGPFKGVGIEGAPLSAEALAYLQSRVENINQHFLAAVQRGRGLNATQLGLVSDGRVHLAAAAQQLGLIDTIQSYDDTLALLRSSGAMPHRLLAAQDAVQEKADPAHGALSPTRETALRRESAKQLHNHLLAHRQHLEVRSIVAWQR